MKHLFLGALCLSALSVSGQTFKEWQNPEINQVNRLPMHSNFFAYDTLDEAMQNEKQESDNFMTLNGKWKFFWVENADQRPTDFFRLDYNDKGWDNLNVPAVWELNG